MLDAASLPTRTGEPQRTSCHRAPTLRTRSCLAALGGSVCLTASQGVMTTCLPEISPDLRTALRAALPIVPF
jgi:hypothetical protein